MNFKRAIGGFLLSLVFLIFFAYIISGVQWFFENSLKNQNKASLGSLSDAVQNIAPEDIKENAAVNPVQPVATGDLRLEVNAKSAISVESNLSKPGAPSGSYPNKIIFEKNSDMQLPIASLTKLMTAVIVLDNYNLSDTWQADKIADSQDPMKQDIKLGDVMTVESFLKIMLVGSSNKSAYALSELIGEQNFIALMNQKAKDLGLEKTIFADPTGLSPKNISTAGDLVRFAEHILKNYPKIADISKAKELYIAGFGNVINTDQLLQDFPEAVFSKTGFTTKANGCLLLVINSPKSGGYLISVVLGADDRFSEMKKLITLSRQMLSE